MDIANSFSVIFMLHTQFKSGISQVQLHTNGAIKAVLGNNSYQLTCTHSGLTPSEIQGLLLKLIKDGLSIMVSPPLFTGENAAVNSTFSGRISVDRFTADNPTTTVTFQSIECGDEGSYSWEGSYFMIESGQSLVSQTQNITVRALPMFGPDVSRLTYTPNINIAEGDKVAVTCSGDVGNNPVGIIAWFYFRSGESKPVDESSNAVSTVPQVSRVCSRSRASTLEIILTRNMNNMVVRCTVQQDIKTPDGEGHIQINTISVMYKPVIRSIIRYPDKQLYVEGLEHLKLTCNAEGNPPPSYYWLFDNSTRAANGSIVLIHLTLAQGGAYTCVAYNYIKGVIHKVYASTNIVIQKATSTSFRTTVMDGSTITPNEEETLRESTTCESKSGFVVGMIVGVVIGAFSVGAAGITAMLARRLYKRRKDPEQQKNINTELKTSSEQSIAFTGIHNYVDMNGEGNERLYQSLHRNHQYANQASENEGDYTGLNARNHENSASKASDEPTERVQGKRPTTSDSCVQANLFVETENLHHYQRLQRDNSSFETGYSKLYVNRT